MLKIDSYNFYNNFYFMSRIYNIRSLWVLNVLPLHGVLTLKRFLTSWKRNVYLIIYADSTRYLFHSSWTVFYSIIIIMMCKVHTYNSKDKRIRIFNNILNSCHPKTYFFATLEFMGTFFYVYLMSYRAVMNTKRALFHNKTKKKY